MNGKISPAVSASVMPSIIALIADETGESWSQAYKSFLTSKVFEDYISDGSIVASLSSHLIRELYLEEMETGDFDFPEVI